jgi:xanthine/uracil permease
MSWPKAIALGVVIVAVMFGLLVVVPDLLVGNLSGIARSGRVAVATGWFVIALVGLLWSLRRLQGRLLAR